MRVAGVASFTLVTVTVVCKVLRVVDIAGLRRTLWRGGVPRRRMELGGHH
jgi:hypothetical protein